MLPGRILVAAMLFEQRHAPVRQRQRATRLLRLGVPALPDPPPHRHVRRDGRTGIRIADQVDVLCAEHRAQGFQLVRIAEHPEHESGALFARTVISVLPPSWDAQQLAGRER